jgi:hypothetical protein
MPSIRDFSGGVVNQELLGKDNGTGIIIDANNVLSSWNGELRKRTGSRIIAQLEKKSRIIPYRLPNNDDALLLFTDGNVKGYEISDSGLSLLPVGGSSSLSFPLHKVWTSGTCEDWSVNTDITHTGSIDTIFGSTGENFISTKAEEGRYIGIHNKSTGFVLNSIVFNFQRSSGSKNSYFTNPYLEVSDDGLDWEPVATSFNITTRTVEPGVGPILYYVYLEITNTSTTIISGKYWRVVFSSRVSNGMFSIKAKSIKVSSATENLFDYNTNYAEDELQTIRFGQHAGTIVFSCEGRIPSRIANNQGAIEFNDFTPSSTPKLWEINGGYPSCVSWFQNRLWFGGFAKYPSRVVGSEFGNSENFTIVDSGTKATDPISTDSVMVKNKITNIWSGDNVLYVLSPDGVSMLDAQGGVVATDQINFKLRNREPADSMTPTVKDDIMIYLGSDRRKIFITDYDFIVQRFKAKDLSIGYNGFLTSRIVALHYASRKCSLIYGYKDDGNMLALLFDVDMQKNALFPLDIGGDIKDMQVFKSGDKFRVLMVAQIADRWYLVEKNEQPEYTMMDFMTEEQKSEYAQTVMSNGLYLDYMTRRYYSEPVSVITDVPYAVGTKVAVFADGNYIGEKDCTADGIVLDSPASDFVLGYNYDAYAVLKLAAPYTSKKYPKEVATYLINTGYLEIGNSFDNLQPILNNMRDKLDLFYKPMLLNGEYTKTMDKLDNSPYIILRSNEPMPFMITGIDFKVDYSNYQGGI